MLLPSSGMDMKEAWCSETLVSSHIITRRSPQLEEPRCFVSSPWLNPISSSRANIQVHSITTLLLWLSHILWFSRIRIGLVSFCLLHLYLLTLCQLQRLYSVKWNMTGWLWSVNSEEVVVAYFSVLSRLTIGSSEETMKTSVARDHIRTEDSPNTECWPLHREVQCKLWFRE
jgi:hypothetical protein